MIKTITLGLTILLSVSACTSNKPEKLNLMAAPEIYHDDRIAPFDDSKIDAIERPVQLFYATDRSVAENPEQWPYYSSARGHVLRLGRAQVSMGGGQYEWEQIKEISLQRNRPSKYFLELNSVNEFGVLDLSAENVGKRQLQEEVTATARINYTEAINRRLAKSPSKDIYIYTHGYRVNFDYPLLVSGELWHFLGYDGAFIAYSWAATPSAFAYASDIETARYASRNFRLFLNYLADHTDAERIHIIGYSAGNRTVIDALWQMAVSNPGQDSASLRQRFRIGEVMILASDYDQDLFVSALRDGILEVPESMTVYRSETDKALGFSSWLLNRNRLGEINPDEAMTQEEIGTLAKNQELRVINVSRATRAGSGNGHDYFRNSPWVSNDVFMALRFDLSPGERGLYQDEGSAIWQFPEDYIERLRQSLELMEQ
jgi:esterase/lipase superfamily enzyme